ncbi:SusD family protein [Mariniphaga anaerophila]|uniref:SusD family protein n=1 Tax=Mariniphaga anaerophila TaxID=1484053 RepID=A0A1M4U6V2_9BACT|nr:RagB/SusD family nutrient uptake outer membrane protein [Mariniphaga anaerophila]SHE52378.1 SusD family protein [Mariniphaga anaerophila]
MKTNRIYKILAVLALPMLLLTVSCEDVLEKEPITSIAVENTYKTEADMISAVNSVYDVLQWQSLNGSHCFPLIFQGIRSDDLHSQQANFWALGADFDNFSTILPHNASVLQVWNKWYQGVSRANTALHIYETFEFTTPGLRERLEGEAKFLRALCYFELVRLFGGVPLLTEAITSTDQELFLPRASTSAIYDQILQDCSQASSLLPKMGSEEQGRATAGAALALEAKANLYNGNWSEVVRLCEEIMGHGYDLETNFADNFELDNEFGIESIFEINYVDGLVAGGFETGGVNQQEGSGAWQMMFMWLSGKYTSWGNFIPRQSLIAIYDEADTRLDATFIVPGTVLNSPGLAAVGWDPAPDFTLAVGSSAYCRKYFLDWEEVDALLSVQQSPKNEKIIRYADVLLMHAEASAMGGGGNGQASLDAIRERAGLGSIPLTLENVKSERRKELATEGWNRFTDLVRWGDAASNPVLIEKGFKAGRDELLPIPQTEINIVGSDLLPQNPGYNQ